MFALHYSWMLFMLVELIFVHCVSFFVSKMLVIMDFIHAWKLVINRRRFMLEKSFETMTIKSFIV